MELERSRVPRAVSCGLAASLIGLICFVALFYHETPQPLSTQHATTSLANDPSYRHYYLSGQRGEYCNKDKEGKGICLYGNPTEGSMVREAVMKDGMSWRMCAISEEAQDVAIPVPVLPKAQPASLASPALVSPASAKLPVDDGTQNDFQKIRDAAVDLSEGGQCTGETRVMMFNFGIGSLFNEESKRTSFLKSELETLKEPCVNGVLSEEALQALDNSIPPPQLLATVKGDFSRQWTYPSNAPWYIWAVSLHQTNHGEGSKHGVFGGVAPVSEDEFVALRPREKDYEVLTIPPQNVSVKNEDGNDEALLTYLKRTGVALVVVLFGSFTVCCRRKPRFDMRADCSVRLWLLPEREPES